MDRTYTVARDDAASSMRAGLAAVAAAALALAAGCSVAILNGFPLIFSDSQNYVASGATLTVPWGRPIFYGLFLRPLLFADLWPAVLAQSALIAYVTWIAARVVRPGLGAGLFSAMFVALCLFSTLPWVAGQIMPGIFTGVVILGTFVVVFANERVARAHYWSVAALTTLAVSTHLSHVFLLLVLLPVCAVCRFRLAGRRQLGWRVGVASVGLVVAVAAILFSNVLQSGRPVLSRGGTVFALAKLLESGAPQAYLAQTCPGAGLALCAEADALPRDANAFLWSSESPLRRLGREALAREAGVVVIGSVASYPLRVAGHAALSALRQLASFSVASGRRPEDLAKAEFSSSFEAAAQTSRQARAALPFAAADRLASAGLLIAVVALATLLVVGMSQPLLALTATVLVGVLANALICGALSVVDGRYQARVVWLVAFAGLLAMAELWDRWRERHRRAAGVAGGR